MLLGILAALFCTIGLGDLILSPYFSKALLSDEMAEIDARIDGRISAEEESFFDEDEEPILKDHSVRFGVWFLGFALAFVLGSSALSSGFLGRFSHPGVAVIHMRSEDPQVRRSGLEMLAERLDFDPSPQVIAVVLRALEDPNEGVAARAAYVAGILALESSAPRLVKMIKERPALSFSALISLGQTGTSLKGQIKPKVRTAAQELLKNPNAQAEPRALAIMLGLLRLPAVETLRQIYESKDEQSRLAALWALGELKDRRLFKLVAGGLKDEALSVRCAAALALEKMVTFEASVPLRAAFELEKDPASLCREVTVPVQEGGLKIVMLPQRLFHVSLIRAMATTDDPELILWLEQHQDGVTYESHALMKKLWERLKKKQERGELNIFKDRLRLRRAKRDAER